MKTNLRTIFQSPFSINQWYVLLQDFFKASELKSMPEKIESSNTEEGYYLGNIQTSDFYRIGLFHYKIKQGSVANKRVGLRNLVKTFINPRWGEFEAALVIFDSGDHWRLSFICDINGEATAAKRYTYVFGSKELLYKTPIDRFIFLKDKGMSFENLKKAFSVEALSDEFFDKYREQYADFIQYITGKRFVKSGSKWEEKTCGIANEKLMQAFGNDEKKIRDYIKKMMGRITFLHFLQRKGWMCGDLNYMQNLFERSAHQDDYLDYVLEPLFFGILNTKPEQREALFEKYSWDKSLLAEWSDIPYLNGGLFERDENDEPESKFPAEYFERLFNFFSEYNFTIDENDPNDAEVGVDPEMLGKIFENLLEDNKDKGAFYTPKEIVRYMCQESLIAYLDTATSIAAEKIRKFVITPEEGVSDIPENKKGKLLDALKDVKICDPAIGSGAFPMGLLNELLKCREALLGTRTGNGIMETSIKYENEIKNIQPSFPSPYLVPNSRSQIKKDIIQNNIYGVDIEKGAVDIARLRFWLSIVVDEETPSPLPNLDYKIMQGNSLIESYRGLDLSKLTYAKKGSGHITQYSIFEDDTKQEQRRVTELLSQYYSCCDHSKKKELRDKISDTINKQLSVQNFDHDILRELRTLDLAGNDHFFLWHTWFSDVFSREGDKKGFDIVIGNPPYISALEAKKIIDPIIRQAYKDKYQSACGTYDMYVIFIELGLRLLAKNGILVFITPSKYLSAEYATTLRTFILENYSLDMISDFSDIRVFESAGVSTMISQFSNNKQHNKVEFKTYKSLTEISSLHVYPSIVLTMLPNNLWGPLLSDKIELFFKIYNKSDVIENHADINACSTASEAEQFERNLTEIEGIDSYKYINNGTINRYVQYWGKKPIRTNKMLRPYLKYQYMNQRRKDMFSLKKLIFVKLAKTPQVYYDEFGEFASANTNMVYNLRNYDYKFLLGYLNSHLFNFVYHTMFGGLSMLGTVQIQAPQIKKSLIPKLGNISQKEIIDIVDNILQIKKNDSGADTSLLEQEIDKLVYKLYGLTEEEIRVVEGM